MKPADRDALLARLDERTRNIWRSVEKIEKHNEKQNGQIVKNRIAIIGLACFLTGVGVLEWRDVINIFGQ